MICSKCHFENPSDAVYCGNCGTSLELSQEITVSKAEELNRPMKELVIGSTFTGRYQIIEELGIGGMGTVYRALDKKLDEDVVLKLIKPEIASDQKVIEQFSDELKLARKISHRNVGRTYEIQEDKGTHYIIMEYVSGQDLRRLIRQTGKLTLEKSISLAKQMCEGLAEAHRVGVIHRDLKSSNIMVDSEGNVRIMDFGLARSLEKKGKTMAGAMIGTPSYMPPEQVEGKKADQRSDIYSLGVILYEMVTGRVPFEGDTVLGVIMKQRSEVPRDPRELNTQIPEDLSRVILRCLEKDREKRYQRAEELLSELTRIEKRIFSSGSVLTKKKFFASTDIKAAIRKRWVMITAVLLLVAVVAGRAFLYFRNNKPVFASSEKKALVVLPFENLGLPEDEYFADGLTEEITSRLSALHGIRVISRTSAVKYKNTDKTIKQIGEELGVDYVLEGSVRWNRSSANNGGVRITQQLIRVSGDTHIWSEQYDRVIEDIFSVQSEIAEEVAKKLDLAILEPERKALNARPTENLEAYDFLLKGSKHESQGWLYSDAGEFEKALELYEKAVELDPGFALAYARISMVHSRMYFFGIDTTEERLVKTRVAADRAVQLQPDLPDAQMALALYYYRGLLDYDRALEIFETIQKALPNIPPNLLGYVQRRQGNWENALETLKKAFKLSPRYSQLAYEIGLTYLSMRRYEKAKEWFNRTLSINPNHLAARLGKIGILILSKGNTEEARGLLTELPQHRLTDFMWITLGLIEKNHQEVLNYLDSLPYDSFKEQHFYFEKNLAYASVYHAMKEFSLMATYAERARIIIERVVRESPRDPRFHAALGLAYAYLGRKEEAIQEGTRATALLPVSKDAALGPTYILNLARIYTVVGEYKEAMDNLTYLLSIPSSEFLWQIISVPSMRIDPMWEPLGELQEFRRLLGVTPKSD
ncbi:MAG: protein kinase [Candidatus Aminicenantaceae bacterium]